MYAGHFDFALPMLQVVERVYAPSECQQILTSVAASEWLPATINRASGREVDARIRDNLITMVRDEEMVATLWSRIAPHVPATMSSGWDGPRRAMKAHGLYEPLRVYRYEVGHYFGLHTDQSYAQAGSRSLLTLLVYLDDDFDGGETDFPEQQRTIAPRAGDALWFQHAVLHAGNAVTRGTKHVLRTDVLYVPV
jgi:predicted 2-oxoglutarate/Fe(II)-dependent dioxygenase YbiX